MTDFHARTAHQMKREVSADGGALFRTLVRLWPYIWPSDRRDLQGRVALATLLLFGAKLATVFVPFTFKWAVDALTGQGSAPVAPDSWLAWAIAAPVLMTLAYGGVRILMAGLTQLRDGVFAKVAMHAVRRLALLTFQHMHELALRFHLERKTGGLTRVLERGRNGIETIVRMVILQLLPTILEVALIIGVLLYQFDWRYVLVILFIVALYMWFTYYATEWRIGIRRRMNDSDSDANTKAMNSLLNYETVKYFVAEARETRRYDRAMERYETASVKSYMSLAVLNAGQAAIFTIGLAATMVMCAHRRAGRHQHGRRFRDDQCHDDPALPAAQFHGHGLSRDQAGDGRYRDHVQHPAAGRRRSSTSPAPSRWWWAEARSGSRTSLSPTSRRGRSSRA